MVPIEMRTRFFSIIGVFCLGAVPFGSLICRFVLSKFAYQYVLFIVVTIFLIATLIFMARAVPKVYEPNALKVQI
ncbi:MULTISPECIES: hypothetical protein [Clostridium]|nr:hypothetical protein [Clostridium autoethanogenum]URS74445.1 hypothetical protein CAETHG_05010 [Clostridium autoethanogenum DSM 10061]